MSAEPAIRTVTPLIDYESLPGPPGVPVLGNALQVKSEVFHQKLETWGRQYGRRFRFRIASRRFIGINDPEAIASVLKRRPESFVRSERIVQVATDLGFLGLFMANGESWRRQRRFVLPGLDPAHLRSYLPAIVTVTERLRSRWMAKARSGEDIDVLSDLMRYTVDVTTCLAFGQDLNTMEQGDGVRIQQHLNVVFPTLFRRTLSPIDMEHWFPDKNTQAHVQALREAVQEFIATARLQLAQESALRDRPQNLIQAMIATHDSDGGLSDDDISGNVLTMLLAGEDTTANTVAWLLWLIHCNRSELPTLRAEVDSAIGRHSVAQAPEQLDALGHVLACANEAMRLKPVAPINIVEAAEDTEVDGVQVPKGILVACVMRAPGMNPERFEEPHEFRPSRWLHGEAAVAGGGMFSAKRVVMPFGAGPRVCPGRYLALAEIKMADGHARFQFRSRTRVGPRWRAPGAPDAYHGACGTSHAAEAARSMSSRKRS